MSCDLGQDVPGSENLYARKLWADFLFPKEGRPVAGKSLCDTAIPCLTGQASSEASSPEIADP